MNHFSEILRFFFKDKTNWWRCSLQIILSCLCSALEPLEFFVLAFFIPYQKISSPFLNTLFEKIHVFIEQTHWTWLLFPLASLFLLKTVCNFANAYFLQIWQTRLEIHYRTTFLAHTLQKPLLFLEQKEPGQLAKNIEQNAISLSQIPAFAVNYLIKIPVALITSISICLLISWQLLFVLLPTLFIFYWLKKQATKPVQTQIKSIRSFERNDTSHLVNFFQGLTLIKLWQLDHFILQSYQQFRSKYLQHRLQITRLNLAFAELTNLLLAFSLITCAVFVFWILKSSIQEVILMIGALRQIHQPIKSYSKQLELMERAVAALDELEADGLIPPELSCQRRLASSFSVDNLDASLRWHDKAEPVFACLTKYQIEFDQVCFSYGDKIVLDRISFTIKKGEKIALVGPNGSGKSTLLKLMCGAYPILSGHIRFDGVLLGEETKLFFMEHITYTPQKPFLFCASIRDNIDIEQKLDLQQIKAAAQKASAREFIEDLPKQYDTILNNDGSNLSVGQRQKIHLSRSFARNTSVMIFDEATASLDLASERQIFENCLQDTKQTQIFVSHRETILSHVDKVICLKNGRVHVS